jgi:hypothetical protein
MENLFGNRRLLLLGGAIILVFGLLFLYSFTGNQENDVSKESQIHNNSEEEVGENEPEVTNFEECEKNGGELFGDFSEQCRLEDDRVFTRELTEEEKRENEVVEIKNRQKTYQNDYLTDFKIFYPSEWNLETSEEFTGEKLVNTISINKSGLQIKYVIDIYQLPRGIPPECISKSNILEKEEVKAQQIDRIRNEFIRYRFKGEPDKYYYLPPSEETNPINPCASGEESISTSGYTLDLKEGYPFGPDQLVSKGLITISLEGNPGQKELQEVDEIIFLTEGISQS